MITCPKCHYKRTAADTAPDWQCPSCGVVYAKVNARPREAPEEPMAKELTLAEAQHNPLIGYFLIGAAVIALVFISYKWLSRPKAPLGASAPQVVSSDVARAQADLRLEGIAGFLSSRDYAKALPVLNEMAAANHPRAQFHLARLYINGYGVPKDIDKALLLYKQASDQGDVPAELDLGTMHKLGKGVPQSHGVAASWYRRAARGGDAAGLYCLAGMYEKGLGVNPNLTMAYMLYEMAKIANEKPGAYDTRNNDERAASSGCSPSFIGLVQTELAKKMSLVQVQRAKEMAKTWTFDQPIPE